MPKFSCELFSGTSGSLPIERSVNNKNERQHYVSKVLLKRFRLPGSPLHCYQIDTGLWKKRSVERTCSAPGYNQILVAGIMNNALEDSFSRIETNLPETLTALDAASNVSSTEFSEDLYKNLCSYCTFLLGTSLFAKPVSVVTFLAQINYELENGSDHLLRELNTPEDVIKKFREGYKNGGRIIIESENVLQTVYRFQFQRSLNINYADFFHCKWTVYNSPIELPMSDIGLITMRLDDIKAKHYLLPISPWRVLEGVFFYDQSKHLASRTVYGRTLNQLEAEYILDCICHSAVLEIVCSNAKVDVATSRERAIQYNTIKFNKIVNPRQVIVSGLQNSSTAYSLQMVSCEDYRKFVHSFIQPPD